MLAAEAAPLLYRELSRIAAHTAWTPGQQVLALASLQERLFFELTKQEQLAFSTLFARISYAAHRHNLQRATLRRIHALRHAAIQVRNGAAAEPADVATGIQALAETILVTTQTAIPPELIPLFSQATLGPEEPGWEYKSATRVVAVDDLPGEGCLLAHDESAPGAPVKVLYGLPDRNENFNPTIQIIRKVMGFPVTLQLLDVDIDGNGAYRPRVLVLEPDYLMDVSALAECFKDTGADPYYFLVKKFLPYETTPAILLGNIANLFLDRLLTEPDISWEELFRETFQLYPFAYAPMNDREVKEISQKAQKHFVNLKSMTAPGGGFAREGIHAENCILEPTFFSQYYGIQGRLDLFYRTEEKSAIVELKSGTPFKPNNYGIQRSHFTQTLLYDLLVRSVFGRHTDPVKYILYSGADVQHLRFAPTVAPEQWEALQLRNQLLALERLLCAVKPGEVQVPALARLRASAGVGFLQRDYGRFEQAYNRLDDLEKKYFNAFAGFIAREQWMAKVGEEEEDNLNGHAALWRATLAEKQQAFRVLDQLEIVENRADQPDPTIVFRRTADTDRLANFRVGDIAVLYPAESAADTVMDHQVIKCTLTELGASRIVVQLRYRQFNLKPFETADFWRLEPDLMETGFTSMYRSLFEWAEAPPDIRQKIMYPVHGGGAVLWGPPGTGKTSVMLRDMAANILHQTTDNLLLLAYTNRAVDEICEALDSIGGDIKEQYLRIGSRFSTAERFRPQLLSNRIAGVRTRAELRNILEATRIFVSTVASFSQNDGLLKLKKFQRLIVDEASQLLEPQIIGLLTRFEQFTLIGDHRQLPAVVAQKSDYTRVDDADLQSIGLYDLRNSYFERLYKLYENYNLTEYYSKLSRQGRMHADIMDFPNRHFYGGMLQTLPDNPAQQIPMTYRLPDFDPALEPFLTGQRVLFLPVAAEDFLPGQKTSKNEAALVVRLVKAFQALFQHNNLPWSAEKSLGIITPWRAQIAQIRDLLAAADLNPDELTTDTVERYQGGARDVIIVSCCVHTPAQLATLTNISEEGIDRKLNVALTRARKHIIVLGNPEVLQRDDRYRAFIEQYGVDIELFT